MKAIISAVIVNYNAGELLLRCVESILSSDLAIEVVVVDNASADNSLDLLADYAQLTVVKNEKNLGFAAACNIGMKKAQTDYFLFLNPDCSLYPGALEELINALRQNQSAGMAGGLLVNPDGSEQGGGRRAVPTPWRSLVRILRLNRFAKYWPRLFFDFYLHNEPLPTQPIEVEAISGACMLVKRDAVDQIGYWDDGYFLHCEDLDWCMRFRQKGWKVLFVPSARVRHDLGACGRTRPVFVEWHKHKGMCRFYRKFFRHQYPGMMGFVMLGVGLHFLYVAIRQKVMDAFSLLGVKHGG